jgi:lipoate-protein ligase A
MNIRYINLGGISGTEIAAEQELTEHIVLQSPTIMVFYAKDPTITMTGDYGIEEYLYPDKIPSSVDVVRIYGKGGSGGALCLDQNSLLIHLHIEEKYLPENIDRFMLASVVRVVKKYGITLSLSPHRMGANDLVIKDGENYRKTVGVWRCSYRKDWLTFGLLICFKPNFEIMSPSFRLDTSKMSVRNVSKIEDAVGGIGETLNKDKIAKEISQEIAYRLDLVLRDDILTKEETAKMKDTAQKLSSNDWRLYARRPKFE